MRAKEGYMTNPLMSLAGVGTFKAVVGFGAPQCARGCARATSTLSVGDRPPPLGFQVPGRTLEPPALASL